ncbi:MAG: DUF3048 domain-containing protein [Chloroflexi bacterium]|jgi:hypothetical protein|nr:DUF3048 domain-containing protein [Chloroflexota bacterium]
MLKTKSHLKMILLGSMLILMAACSGKPSVDLELAATYAAQTLAAMPKDVEEQLPTATQTEAAPTATATFTATPLPVVQPSGPVDFPENVNPLTGLVVDDPSILDRRPILVKVANYPISGRPHSGLSFADMVFEYYIGTGGNRFIALYYGQDADTIGPVRSGRMIDPYLTSLYEGILGMEGAYVTVRDHIAEILENRMISSKELCPGLCDDGRMQVISVFGDSAALTEIAARRGVVQQRYLLEGMAFDPEVPGGGETAVEIKTMFSTVNPEEWRYDKESGYYLRWTDNETGQAIDMIPLVDRITDEQLAFANVVVIFANYDEIAPTLHDMAIWDNYDGKRAVVFRDGLAYDITWKTPNRNQPIQFFDTSGEVFRLKPGNTWVVVMGSYSAVTADDGNWAFTFFMP